MGVWIETHIYCYCSYLSIVTPRVGVWIETTWRFCSFITHQSLPVWECGLKLLLSLHDWMPHRVTPRVGVWIETINELNFGKIVIVTPRVGVWIETSLLQPGW